MRAALLWGMRPQRAGKAGQWGRLETVCFVQDPIIALPECLQYCLQELGQAFDVHALEQPLSFNELTWRVKRDDDSEVLNSGSSSSIRSVLLALALAFPCYAPWLKMGNTHHYLSLIACQTFTCVTQCFQSGILTSRFCMVSPRYPLS